MADGFSELPVSLSALLRQLLAKQGGSVPPHKDQLAAIRKMFSPPLRNPFQLTKSA
jgi:hypothetical protein